MRTFRRKRAQHDAVAGYLFIAPNLLLYFAFTVLPFLFSLVVSFSSWDYTQGFAGIRWNWGRNYLDLLSDTWFLVSLKNNIFFVVGTVPATIGISMAFAAIIDKAVVRKDIAKLMMFLPYISNIVAVSIVWTILLAPQGPLARAFASVGINTPVWLADPDWVMYAIVAMSVWLTIGYAVMLYSAAIGGIPSELYEAAEIDGASSFQQFFRITVPMLSHTTFFLLVTLIVAGFKVFGQIMTMTQGGPGSSSHVLVYYIYTSAFTFFRMGYASSVAVVLFLIMLGITLLQWRVQRKWEESGV